MKHSISEKCCACHQYFLDVLRSQFLNSCIRFRLYPIHTRFHDFGNGDLRLAAVTYDALGNIMSKTGVGR